MPFSCWFAYLNGEFTNKIALRKIRKKVIVRGLPEHVYFKVMGRPGNRVKKIVIWNDDQHKY